MQKLEVHALLHFQPKTRAKVCIEGIRRRERRFRSTSNWIRKIPLLRSAATDLESEHLQLFLCMPKSTPHKRKTFMVVQTVSETMQQL